MPTAQLLLFTNIYKIFKYEILSLLSLLSLLRCKLEGTCSHYSIRRPEETVIQAQGAVWTR